MKKNYSFGIVMMLAMLFASLMAYTQPVELVARYAFDETEGTVVADASGNGFDATLTMCNSCWVEGTIDGALEFDGLGTYVTLPADVMGLTNDNGSVAFWMNSAEPSSIYTMFWAGDNTTGGGFGSENEIHIHLEQAATDIWAGGEVSYVALLGGDESEKTFLFSDPTKGGDPATPPSDDVITLKDEEWHHIACTWGEGYVKLYIDGVVIWDTTAYEPISEYELNNIFLGTMANESRPFVGKMDEFRIYTGVLIDQEVQTLFNKDFTRLNQKLANESTLSVYPNPVSEEGYISFNADAGKNVSVNLYSVTGAHVDNLYNGISASGVNRIQLNAEKYSSGLYLVELEIGNQVSHTKFIVK